MFYKQGVLKNIAKFTGKHRCQSFFFYRAHLVAAFSVSEIESLYLLNDLINITDIISKMQFVILLRVTENQSFTLSLENTISEKS